MSSSFTEIDLNFKGYYSPTDPGIPEKPGIYCIYSTKPSSQNNSQDSGQDGAKRDLVELLYIGQSRTGEATLKTRIQQHASTDYPASGQYLYSCVELRRDQLDMVENALVFQFKPRNNKNLTDKYTHSDVDITVKGSCAGLEDFRLYNGTERF